MGVTEWELLAVLCISVFLAVVETGDTWRVKTKACPQGCNSCSLFNGCITCKPRYLLLLHRSNMKQLGYCRRTCPPGYYASRGGDINRCSKCRVDNCESCLSRSFCVRCRAPYYAHNGGCYTHCPDNTWADRKSGDCLDTVDCEVSDWSNWGECRKSGADCGYKWGTETRLRGIINQPSPGGKTCLDLAETRECRMLQRYCPDDELDPATGRGKNNKGDSAKRKNKRRKSRRRDRGRTRKSRSRSRKKNERSSNPPAERTKPRSRNDEAKALEISRDLTTDLLSI